MVRLTERISERTKSMLLLGVGGAGLLLMLLAIICVFRLSSGSVEAKLVMAILTGALGVLGVGLLRREGCDMPTLLMVLLPLGLGFLLRIICLDYVSQDYINNVSPWVEFFRDNGGFAAIRDPIGNYSTPYLYIMSTLSMLPLPDHYGFKLFTILFDLLLSWGGMRIIRVFHPQSRLPEGTFAMLFLLPTVLVNGALWGHSDSIMGALVLLSLASVLENHPRRSIALAAAAFAFNAQAVYVLPMLLVVWFNQRVRLRQLVIFPVICLLLSLPAILMGKPISDILGVTFRQVHTDLSRLTLNAPNLYAWFPQAANGHIFFTVFGVVAALIAAAGILLLCFRYRSQLRDHALLPLGLLFSLVFPFLLPHVHERYFFLAGVLSVILAFYDVRWLPVASLIQLASLNGCYATLMGKAAFPLPLGTLMMLVSILWLLKDYLPVDLVEGAAALIRQARRNFRHQTPARNRREKK